MEKIRVLIVDDSSVVRRIVTEELSAASDLDVVGAANNGAVALEKASQLAPDLVVLDIEMPEMDGLTALTHLRARHPRLPVIMFSSRTELGAAATLEALSRGASDFFAKPSGAGGLDAARLVIRNELIPAIRELGRRKPAAGGLPASAPRTTGATGVAPSATSSAAATTPPPRPAGGSAPARIDVVAIGASTGGPNALADLFAALPADFPVPIVVVQHMPPMFTRLLAERLAKHSRIATVEAEPGMTLSPGRAWVAPGDFHLEVVREGHDVRTRLHQEAAENACRPAVDPLFRSVAAVFGRHALAVVLTGMGQDGLRGCQAIRAAAGQVLAQDEASSVVWGMPGAVVRAGLADRVSPLSLLASEIVRRARVGRE